MINNLGYWECLWCHHMSAPSKEDKELCQRCVDNDPGCDDGETEELAVMNYLAQQEA